MIDNYLKTGMVFYDDQSKQHFRSSCCKETFCQFIDKDHFPSFQFFTDVPISIDNISIYIYDLEDRLIAAFDEADFNVVNTIYHGTAGYTYVHNMVDVISYPAGIDYETCYYLKICHEDTEFLFAAIGDFCVYTIDDEGILTLRGHHDPGCDTEDVWGKGKFAFVAAGGLGLHSYYINPIGIPTHLDDDDQEGYAYGVWGDGNFIYLANGTNGLESYSVAANGDLTHLSNNFQGDQSYSVWGDGDYIYVANGTNGLDSYTVDGAGALTWKANNATSAAAIGVWGDGDYIYVADANRGIDSYTVGAGGALTWKANDPGSDVGADVWGDGNFVYLASNNGGIDSYSVAAGGVFTLEDNIDQPGVAYGVGASNNFVFLANNTSAEDDQRGILVYSVDGAGVLTYVSYANSNSALDVSKAVFWKGSEVDFHSCWYSEAFRICDNCKSNMIGDGLNLVEGGRFENWDGAAEPNDFPEGWILRDSDDENFVEDAGGECRMESDGTNPIRIEQEDRLIIGRWYVLTFEITDWVEGGLRFRNPVTLITYETAGVKNFVFQAAATDFDFQHYTDTDITFTNVRIEEFVGFDFCDRMTLNWWSDCDWDNIIYQYGYMNSLILADPETVVLQLPSEDIVVNPEERLGELFPNDVIIKKRYRFKIRIPEYLWNALIRLPVYGSEMPNFHCWIALPDGTVCPMSEVIVKGDWDTGNCMNTFEVEFIDGHEYPVVAGNCCGGEDVSEV